LRAKKRDKKP